MRRLRLILGWALMAIGSLVLLALAGIALSSLLRSGSALQYASQLLMEMVGPAIFLALLLGAFSAGWRWHRKRGRLALAMTLAAVVGAIAAGLTLGGYVETALVNGVSINPLQALRTRTPWAQGLEARQFTYDRYDGKDVKLLVYSAAARGTPAPILVHIHGGGWVQGSANERGVDARWLADRGYLVVDVDYSLSSSTRHLWNVTLPQLGCALAWIARNDPRLGGNPHRLALYGESAGGNLVLDLAHLVSRGALRSRCGGEIPKVGAVISIYPPVDMAALYAHQPSRIYPLAYIGGTPAQFPERYAAVSPIFYVNGPGAPTLLLTGLDDSLVPVSDTLRYVAERKAARYDIRLIAIPRAGHGFDAIPGSIGNQLFRQSSLQFLATHGLQP